MKIISNESSEKTAYLDFLNGFRGSLALLVLVHHAVYYLELKGDYRFFLPVGYYVGVPGFFILSAYLLTYRIYEEFILVNNSFKSIQLILFKYFIRRTFRVYVPVFGYVTFAFYIFEIARGPFEWTTSWWSILSLNNAGRSHLWTIAPEIKYYFFIPFYAYVTSLITNNRLKLVWHGLCVFIIVYMEDFFRPYDYTRPLINEGGFLYMFTTFFQGSILAMIMYDLNKSSLFNRAIRNESFRFIIGFLSMVIFTKGLLLFSLVTSPHVTQMERVFFWSSFYWTTFLFIFITGAPNFFTNFFTNNFLMYAGKFSYGIYLLHMMCIKIVILYLKETAKLEAQLLFYVIGFSFACGFLFFYLLENNLINLAHKICRCISSKKYFSN